MINKIIRVLGLISFLVLSCCFSGCSDRDLYDKKEITSIIESCVPNAKLVKIEHEESLVLGATPDEYGVNIYTFSVGDFEFQYTNYMGSDPHFGTNINRKTTTYVKDLMNYKKEDIMKSLQRHNIRLFDERQNPDTEITEVISKYPKDIVLDGYVLFQNRPSGMNIYIRENSQLETVYDFLEDVYNSVEKYIPQKHKKFQVELPYSIIKARDSIFEGDIYSIDDLNSLKELCEEKNGLYKKR